ncbi:MAG: DUF502 domain-containing protein [Nitrospirota bacterium]|nr:DUF502 domain-containing protein [Nitrospirota bacterium]MDH5585003.1 DUF502 domain-containing protein [Nitrospirota bacterium]MDH5773675.1 DUF502 domain-containing protein [Nitrospirota bacterium]
MDTNRRRFWDKMDLNDLARNFFEGLLILVPVAATISVAWLIVQGIDGWLNIPIPGVGFLATIALITLTGRYASTVFVQKMLDMMERVLIKAPFVKLLYTSIKDLIEAFMGEKRRFDQPVLVSLSPEGYAEAVGFVTRTDLEFLGLLNHVAVYFPQSYNFAGHLLVFPKAQVRPLDAESVEVMAFIVSGGVSGGPQAQGAMVA